MDLFKVQMEFDILKRQKIISFAYFNAVKKAVGIFSYVGYFRLVSK